MLLIWESIHYLFIDHYIQRQYAEILRGNPYFFINHEVDTELVLAAGDELEA